MSIVSNFLTLLLNATSIWAESGACFNYPVVSDVTYAGADRMRGGSVLPLTTRRDVCVRAANSE